MKKKSLQVFNLIGDCQHFIRMKRWQTGFTLIELLVVMAILGVLLVGLIVAINPGEHIKKAQDSKIQTSAFEFRNAILRYSANHTAYPWDPTSVGGEDCLSGVNDPAGVQVADVDDCTDPLISAGELSQAIQDNLIIKQSLYVTEESMAPNKLMVCYKPESRMNIDDPMTKFTADGESTCTVGSGECYWCTY